MRSRLCRVCSEFHDLAQPWPGECGGHFGVASDPSIQVIRDAIDPFRSMASGKMHDSKSAYRRELRAMGCYEVGNDRMDRSVKALPPVAPDLKRAIEQLRG